MPNKDLDHLRISPLRMFITCEDLIDPANRQLDDIPYTMEAFLNPDSLRFSMGAEWARLSVPGLSQQVLQYSHTKSNEISFTLLWHKLEADRRQLNGASTNQASLGAGWQRSNQLKSTDSASLYKEFLYALTLPIKPGRAPSRVTLIWPQFLQVTGVIESVSFTFNIFSKWGEVMAFGADINLVELRTPFVSARDAIRFFDRVNALQTGAMSFASSASSDLSTKDF